MALSARLLTLRNSPVLLKLPPYLSALCIVIGIAWLFILPLDEYSRRTYVSENAILPGQVHTYFGGSEHNIFRAYRQEVYQISQWDEADRNAALWNMMREVGLKVAMQPYEFSVAGESINGTNVYGLLQGPRADATEAMVLIAAWRNFEGEINYSGVALALTLARYFKRWSIWSKDIILLVPKDSTYGPEAWVSAYHSTASEVTASRNISSLPIKAGALQAAVALDYPVGPWGRRFDKLDVLYDGINGALPNLDLLNTAVSVANGQMGIGSSIHGMKSHSDSYEDRLRTLAKGLVVQSVGHATGPHSAFVPYHVDAITLKTVGDGWHDEMSLGRTTESLFRSINNLLEHLHQSFFFYILLHSNRFVSIGNYLPAAMLLAGSFTVTALALWVQSGQVSKPSTKPAATESKGSDLKLEAVQVGGDVALVPASATKTVERKMLLPAVILLAVHLAGFAPLHLLNSLHAEYLPLGLKFETAASLMLSPLTSFGIVRYLRISTQQIQILQSFSLLFLGAALSTLATLNFSLAFVVGVLAAPLSFVRPLPKSTDIPLLQRVDKKWHSTAHVAIAMLAGMLHAAISPPVVLYVVCLYFHKDVRWVLVEMARGWNAQGVYTPFVLWAVWWPAWVIAGITLYSGVSRQAR